MRQINRSNKQIKQLINQYNKDWQKDLKKAMELFFDELEQGKTVDKAINEVDKTYKNIFNLPDMQPTLVKAAAYGYGIMPTMLSHSDYNILQKAINKPWSKDNLTLSEKLHGTGIAMKNAVAKTIKSQLKANNTWVTMARSLYDGYGYGKVINNQQIPSYLKAVVQATGDFSQSALAKKAIRNINRLAQNGAPNKSLKAAYNQLVTSAQTGSKKALEKAVQVAIAEKSRYVAERLARTETARAWADGFYAKTLNDDDVVAYRRKLGSRHPTYDICDLYANADMFNLGAGVYPKNKVPPIPSHPHCGCRVIEVFRGKVNLDDQKEQINEGVNKYLKNLNKEHRQALLGVRGADEWEKTGDWQNLLKDFKLEKLPKTRIKAKISANTKVIKETRQTLEFDRDALNKHIEVNCCAKMSKEQIKDFKTIRSKWTDKELKAYANLSDTFAKNEYFEKSNRAFYSLTDKTVKMNFNYNIWESTAELKYSGAFKTKFHEESHQLDHLLSGKYLSKNKQAISGVFTRTINECGKQMLDAIEKDVLKSLNEAIDLYNSVNLSNFKNIQQINKVHAKTQLAFKQYIDTILKTDKDKALASMFTDAVGLATKGKIDPHSIGLWGHISDYNKIRGSDGATSEVWANFFMSKLLKNDDLTGVLEQLAPNTMKVYNEIYEEVIDYLSKNKISY